MAKNKQINLTFVTFENVWLELESVCVCVTFVNSRGSAHHVCRNGTLLSPHAVAAQTRDIRHMFFLLRRVNVPTRSERALLSSSAGSLVGAGGETCGKRGWDWSAVPVRST